MPACPRPSQGQGPTHPEGGEGCAYPPIPACAPGLPLPQGRGEGSHSPRGQGQGLLPLAQCPSAVPGPCGRPPTCPGKPTAAKRSRKRDNLSNHVATFLYKCVTGNALG